MNISILLNAILLLTPNTGFDQNQLVGKWSFVKFERGNIDYPESTLSQMSAYFTKRHFLVRGGDSVGETVFTLKAGDEVTEMDLTALDGSKKGTTTKGIISMNKDRNEVRIYTALDGAERPKKLPVKAEEGHELIVLKLIAR